MIRIRAFLYLNYLWEALLDLGENKKDIFIQNKNDSKRIINLKNNLNLKKESNIIIKLNSFKIL